MRIRCRSRRHRRPGRAGAVATSWIGLLVLVLAMPSLAADKPARPPAPEFTVGVDWVNVQRPLTFADLRGRVVILDFWTYGCVNCMHVNDELAALTSLVGDDPAPPPPPIPARGSPPPQAPAQSDMVDTASWINDLGLDDID